MLARAIRGALPCGAMLLAVAALTGCETKGWIDPTSVGRWEKEPLVVPILSNLDAAVDEPNPEFLQATDVRPEDLIPSTHDYVIGKNDLITVSITDLVGPGVETVKSSRVSESGNVSLPMVGQVKAAGETEAQLEQSIVKAYRDANIIQNATVSVTVAEARNRTFSIIGSVTQAGEYAIVKADFRVLDALVSARDTTVPDLEYLYIIRRNDEQPGNATTQPGGAAHENAPARPQTGPVIPEPTSDAGYPKEGPGAVRVALMQTEGNEGAAAGASTSSTTMEAQTAAPTTAANTGARVVIGPDGKPMIVSGEASAPGLAAEPAPAAAATSEPYVFESPAAPTDKRVIKIPLSKLKQGDLRYNVVIRPGDMIVVPPPVIGEYYMAGHVARVGVYSLTDRKITLKMAVASAGMLDGLAIPARTEIVRRVGPNKEVYVRVDLDKVFAGEQPDLYLKPNDVVNVGTNAVAPFLAAIRGAFRFTYGFGFLYDRNFADPNNDNRF
jgi:polysaccharide export outer membrane protein